MPGVALPDVSQQLAQLQQQMPTPASSPPPAVSDGGATGTQTTVYALANHTHASKARRQRVTGINTAIYVWTYPFAFATGSVPVVQAIAEDPSNSAVDSYNVQVVGTSSPTQATLRIIRQTSILGVLNFNSTPGTINLNLIALEP